MAQLPSDFNMDKPDMFTPVFSASQQQYVRTFDCITPSAPAMYRIQEHQSLQNKHEIEGGKILQMQFGMDFGSGVNNNVNVKTVPAYENLPIFVGDMLLENTGIQVSCEPSEEEAYQNETNKTPEFEELVVNALDVGEQGNGIDDPGVEVVLKYLTNNENSIPVDFKPLPSKKKKNPPYLIRGNSKIATRNGEPVRFCLTGAEVCQMVKISMRFCEEKFKSTPVIACPLHNKGENGNCNFEVSTTGQQCQYDVILDHYTASLKLCADNFDDMEDFKFYITFKCLNSCHKENGKRMELILTLIDMQGKALKERRFEIRACKNVKRDYKEAFQDEEPVYENMQPDTFLSADYPQPSTSVVEEAKPVKARGKTVKVKMIHPAGEAKRIKKEHHEERAVQCVPATETENYQQKFYLVQLPDAKRENLALAIIKEFGGKILNLDSVVPADINENNFSKY